MVHAVRKQSDAAAALNKHCALIDALLGGTDAMRAAGKTYLPQWPGEDDKAHATRLAVATLFPAYQRTIEVLGAKPFSKPVTFGKDVPAKIQTLCEDVDRQGRNLHPAEFRQGLSTYRRGRRADQSSRRGHEREDHPPY